MFTSKISITPDKSENIPSLISLLESLLYSWRINGQILGREHPVFLNQNEVAATPTIPEENALEAINNTETARQIILDIAEAGNARIDIKIVGVSPNAIAICECNKPGSYILYTNYASLSSPIRCGDCSFPVPLYKVAPEIDGNRSYVMNWQISYQSCDLLQVNSKIGEQFSQRQVQQHDSPLAKEGRHVCKLIEEHTGQPTYYYLSKPSGKSHRQEEKRKCPSCKEQWLLKEPWHDIFDFKCDPCRLLSNIGWTVRNHKVY